MRTMMAALLATAAGAGAAGCDDGSDPAQGRIRFDDLAVGQQSRYAVLVGAEYGNPRESRFEYVDGVLLAEIVAEDDSGFRVREAFEVPVQQHEDGPLSALEPDVAYEYHLRVDGDDLVVRVDDDQRSRLFPRSEERPLPLGDIATPRTEVSGWATARPYCECYEQAYVADGEIRGTTYDRLNVVIDDEWMQVDGPGFTKIYAADHGLVRSTTYDWWRRRGVGFDLIAD
jgi:hypothetical protein